MSTQPISQPQARKGFTPFPNSTMLDWPRLLSGSVQVFVTMYLNFSAPYRYKDRGNGEPADYWSRPIKANEIAAYCRASVRMVQLALDSLTERGVIEAKPSMPKGSFRYHIPFDKWPDLPTYKPAEVIPISSDTEELEDDDDPEPPAGAALPISEKPQSIRAGLRPRPKDLPAPASRLRVTANSDVQYTGTILNGVLSLELAVIPREQEAKHKRNPLPIGQSNSHKLQTGVIDDRLFKEFERTAAAVGLSYSSFDLGKAYKLWVKLTAADQRAAIDGLVARHAAGEYADPMYRPLIQNYLLKRTWDRAIRKPASKAELKMEGWRRTVEGALKIVREMDRKAGRS